MTYRCAICGQIHDDLPDLAFTWPDHYFAIPENERHDRIQGTADICRIDEYCFIRGIILIPVSDYEQDYGIGVWVSQKPENFQTYIDNFDTDAIGPFFGWLSNEIPFYEESTLNLKTRAHFQGNNQRPVIEPAPAEHRLFSDYSQGITLEKAFEYSHSYTAHEP